MGHGYSSRRFKTDRHSTPNDVKDNLEWIFEEGAIWEDGNRFVYPILTGYQKEFKEQTPYTTGRHTSMTDFDFEAARLTLSDTDTLIDERKKSIGVSIPLDRSQQTESFGKEIKSKVMGRVPEVHIGPTQTRGTGLATSSSSIDTSRSLQQFGQVNESCTSLFSKVAIDDAAKRAKILPKSSTISRKEAIDEQEDSERMEIGAKYLYIDQLLYRMQKSAEYCYKLYHKSIGLNKRLHPKKSEKGQQLSMIGVQKSYDDTMAALKSALSNFDNARYALGWLYSDYELRIALYRCRHHLLLVKRARHAHASEPENIVNSTYVANLDQMTNQLEDRYMQLNSEVQRNELYCITVALHFYDHDQKGYLLARDVPEMSANMFALLDVNNDQTITPNDLHKSVTLLNDRLALSQTTIRRLSEENEIIAMREKSELNSMRMSENQDRIMRLRREEAEDNKTMKAIFKYFHAGFARSVFNKTELELTNDTCSIDSILGIVEDIEKEVKCDPLQIGTFSEGNTPAELQRDIRIERQDELQAAKPTSRGGLQGEGVQRSGIGSLGVGALGMGGRGLELEERLSTDKAMRPTQKEEIATSQNDGSESQAQQGWNKPREDVFAAQREQPQRQFWSEQERREAELTTQKEQQLLKEEHERRAPFLSREGVLAAQKEQPQRKFWSEQERLDAELLAQKERQNQQLLKEEQEYRTQIPEQQQQRFDSGSLQKEYARQEPSVEPQERRAQFGNQPEKRIDTETLKPLPQLVNQGELERQSQIEKPLRIIRQNEEYTLPESAQLSEGSDEATRKELENFKPHVSAQTVSNYPQERGMYQREQQFEYNPEEAEALLTKGSEETSKRVKFPQQQSIKLPESSQEIGEKPGSGVVSGRTAEEESLYNKARMEMQEEAQTMELSDPSKRPTSGIRTIY